MTAPEQAPSSSIVLATGNPHKVQELRALFAQFAADPSQTVPLIGLDLAMPPGQTPNEPKETGRTFEDNARIKALAYATQTGRVCLADDSGLEIDALDGAPGVISSHYSSHGRELGLSREARDSANNQLVLRNLEGLATERRSARFFCVMALAVPPGFQPSRLMPLVPPYHEQDALWGIESRLATALAQPDRAHVLLVATGEFKGRIGIPPRVPSGKRGFGYDPLFLVAPAFSQTSAEMLPEEKNHLSHRASAANQMHDLLVRSGIIAVAE